MVITITAQSQYVLSASGGKGQNARQPPPSHPPPCTPLRQLYHCTWRHFEWLRKEPGPANVELKTRRWGVVGKVHLDRAVVGAVQDRAVSGAVHRE